MRERTAAPPVIPPLRQRPSEDDWVEECPFCYGYGSVACTYCRETGDLDRDNDIDRDCRYCQGWGAVTCTSCGGAGVR